MEVHNYKKITGAGALIGSCDVLTNVEGFPFWIYGIKIMEKDGRQWINLPSEAYFSEDGQKKYKEHNRFVDMESKKVFSDEVLLQVERQKDDNQQRTEFYNKDKKEENPF